MLRVQAEEGRKGIKENWERELNLGMIYESKKKIKKTFEEFTKIKKLN